jgi:POT family proton-dependent oligopeptide transporter
MFKNHPRTLAYIFFAEMWERIGFYTLMAVLVLYMDKVLGWTDARKGDVYGLFLALCYFVPLLGGWIGDRWLGRRTTIRIGAVLMALGYVGLAVSSPARTVAFFFGLGLIGVGTGIFKVNMAVLVGNLYAGKPELRDAGFNIYYMGVNIGATIAPLLATFISVRYGSYNLSFWICGAGLFVALAILQAGHSRLAVVDVKAAARAAAAGAAVVPGAAPAVVTQEAATAGEDRRRIITLVILFCSVVFFWIAFYQNAFALTLFAERSTRAFAWLRAETYQFFEPAFILVLTPLLLALFGRLHVAGREPSTPVKIFLGLLIMAASMLIMVAASLAGGNRDVPIMSPAWLVGTYFFVTLAEILISPMGQSFVSKVAPPRLAGLMMGGWFAATAAGSYGSGLLGKSYSALPHHSFFLILTGLLAVAAVMVAAFEKTLRRFAG